MGALDYGFQSRVTMSILTQALSRCASTYIAFVLIKTFQHFTYHFWWHQNSVDLMQHRSACIIVKVHQSSTIGRRTIHDIVEHWVLQRKQNLSSTLPSRSPDCLFIYRWVQINPQPSSGFCVHNLFRQITGLGQRPSNMILQQFAKILSSFQWFWILVQILQPLWIFESLVCRYEKRCIHNGIEFLFDVVCLDQSLENGQIVFLQHGQQWHSWCMQKIISHYLDMRTCTLYKRVSHSTWFSGQYGIDDMQNPICCHNITFKHLCFAIHQYRQSVISILVGQFYVPRLLLFLAILGTFQVYFQAQRIDRTGFGIVNNSRRTEGHLQNVILENVCVIVARLTRGKRRFFFSIVTGFI